MDIIELFIDEEDNVSGIDAISIVENPAIQEDFVFLKNQEFKLAELDKEKRLLLGPALIPNKPIYRKSGEKEYYIYFSRNTVRKASELFLQRTKQHRSTLEHEAPLKGLTVVESWIVEGEEDKTRLYDMDVPIGTWMVSMKVDNDDVWENYIKTGKVKGFSIEGYFADKLERPNEPKKDKMSKEEIAKAKIEELKQLFTTQKVDLGILDEVKKVSSTIEKDWKEALNIAVNGAKELRNKINSKIKPLNGQALALKNGIDKSEQMLKDLGIGKNSDITQAKKELKIAFKQISELNRIVRDLDIY